MRIIVSRSLKEKIYKAATVEKQPGKYEKKKCPSKDLARMTNSFHNSSKSIPVINLLKQNIHSHSASEILCVISAVMWAGCLACLRAAKWQMMCHVKPSALTVSTEPQWQTEQLTKVKTAVRQTEEGERPADPG